MPDTRYEARDTQYLLGLLADQQVADPAALGVTGISYGGGQSIELAYLRNRIRLADGSFIPWRSPKGASLSIKAAWPRWPWSDRRTHCYRTGASSTRGSRRRGRA